MRHSKKISVSSSVPAQRGFTLIEITLVVLILSIALQIVTVILITIVRQQTAIIRFSTVKREGDQAMIKIKNDIQTRARSISGATNNCTTVDQVDTIGAANQFQDAAGATFYYDLAVFSFNKLRQVEGGVNTLYTSGKVNVTNFAIQCVKPGPFANQLVSIEFDIAANVASPLAAEGNPSLHYSSKVILRP